MPNKLIVTNLLEFDDHVSEFFNSKQSSQVDTIYIDFSKAFDSVNHSLLLKKLYHLDLFRTLIKWILSYLKDRKYKIMLNQHLSDSLKASSGVPQGSHLGPL